MATEPKTPLARMVHALRFAVEGAGRGHGKGSGQFGKRAGESVSKFVPLERLFRTVFEAGRGYGKGSGKFGKRPKSEDGAPSESKAREVAESRKETMGATGGITAEEKVAALKAYYDSSTEALEQKARRYGRSDKFPDLPNEAACQQLAERFFGITKMPEDQRGQGLRTALKEIADSGPAVLRKAAAADLATAELEAKTDPKAQHLTLTKEWLNGIGNRKGFAQYVPVALAKDKPEAWQALNRQVGALEGRANTMATTKRDEFPDKRSQKILLAFAAYLRDKATETAKRRDDGPGGKVERFSALLEVVRGRRGDALAFASWDDADLIGFDDALDGLDQDEFIDPSDREEYLAELEEIYDRIAEQG